MADLRAEGTDVVVHLSALEAVVAWRREVRVPVARLRMVHVEDRPLVGLRLLRLPGLSWPGTFAIGACRHDGRSEFAVVRAGQAAVVLEAEGATWDKVVVSHPDAVSIAAQLAGVLLGRGTGKPGSRPGFPVSPQD
jgi:hypothetical protein